MARVATCYIFDDIYSYGHALWGALTKLAAMVAPILALAMFIGFVIYEVVEDRLMRIYGRAKCDIIEYIIGYVMADIVAKGLLGA